MLSSFGLWTRYRSAGARRPKGPPTRRLACEPLETRALCAVSVTHANGITNVEGDNGDNRVLAVEFTNAQGQRMVRVTAENNFSREVPKGTQMKVNLKSGNDTFDGSALTFQIIVWGGAGNDNLTTGSGNDQVHGGNGNDTIRTNGGNDTLRGGDGADNLHGGAGHDWFFAGYKDGDADIVDMRDGQSTGDRNQNPDANDTVHRDPSQHVAPRSKIFHHSNVVHHFGTRVVMRDDPGAYLYSLSLNGQQRTQWRAANTIGVYSYFFTIDASLRTELEARGWLNWNQLG